MKKAYLLFGSLGFCDRRLQLDCLFRADYLTCWTRGSGDFVSTGPTDNFFRQIKKGSRRLDMQTTGPHTSSSFVWTPCVKESTLDIVLASGGSKKPETNAYLFQKSTLDIVFAPDGSTNHEKSILQLLKLFI